MIQLLFTVILAEMAMLLTLFFKNPIRKLVKSALDGAKRGNGPVMVRTVGGAVLVLFMSSIYSILKIGYRSIDAGSVNQTDKVLMAEKMLVGSLSGFLLFLSMVIDQHHQIMRERSFLKMIIMAEETQLTARKFRIAEHLKVLGEEAAILKAKIKKLEFECETQSNKSKAAQANALALKKQCEEFHLEYDRLIEYNQTLRNQLQSIDQRLLKDNQKTGWTNLKSNIMSSGFIQFPLGIQTSNKNRGEPGSELEVQTTHQSHQNLFSGSHAITSPRHRRPIYQH